MAFDPSVTPVEAIAAALAFAGYSPKSIL